MLWDSNHLFPSLLQTPFPKISTTNRETSFKLYSSFLYNPTKTIPHPLSITCCTYKGAAEQKARSTYEYLIDLTDDPAVLAPLRFLREREIVHFQRFGEALEIARDHLNQQHYFFMQKYGCDTK